MTVQENGVIIGWHPVDCAEVTTVLIPSRWSCFAGIFSPRKYEVALGGDPGWMVPES